MKLSIRNFRSIKEQEIELAPITVVYGANGAGKSSLLYALLTMRNVVLNSNQNPSGFFNYGFVSLGDYKAVVFDHQTGNYIDLALEFVPEGSETALVYRVVLGEKDGRFALCAPDVDADFQVPVSFPYPANQQIKVGISPGDEQSFNVTWNGITAQVQQGAQDQEAQDQANSLARFFNAPAELLRRTGMAPLKRGFSKPHYSSVSLTPMLAGEDEVATVLSTDKYLVSKVSHYLEQICDRDFRVNVRPGTAIFSLDATDRKSGVASELVNEGFGVNQVVHLLARCLYDDSQWICVEEPEIHLHPTAVRCLARAMVKMVRDEARRFVITTHSESFLLALLSLVAEGKLKPPALACYFARKGKRDTVFERQEVNEKGQVTGGLASFMEGELEDIESFFAGAK